MNNKSLNRLLICFSVFFLFAQNIYSTKSFDIAQSFMSKKGIVLVANSSMTRGNIMPYEVFKGKNEKGFAIVCGGEVVGYSTENTFDESTFPDELREMLIAYSEISTKEGTDYPGWFTPRNVQPIPYLVTSKWNQFYPYNEMCPIIDGKRCVAGCTAIALAQAMYYFKLPFETTYWKSKWESKQYELQPTTFDYDKMFDEYYDNIHTQENIDAVAKLVRFCADIVDSSYGITSTCAGWADYVVPNLEHLGFDEVKYYTTTYDTLSVEMGTLVFDNNKYNYVEDADRIIDIIDYYLERGIPLIAASSGHAYLVDGRDEDGLYHFNLGGGGSNNGYYIIKPSKYKETNNPNVYQYLDYFRFIVLIGTLDYVKSIYKLTYQVDGTEYKTYEVEYGATITPEAEPTKEGYTFSGWSEIPETMPAHDVSVTGTFTINKYKLTYTVDGEEYKSYEVEYGAAITPEEAPTKEGYTFSGWSEIPQTMPAKDVTVTGTFSINKYKLTYTVDGEEYKSYEVEYGAAITPEEAPTKEGYTFSGWSEIPETMPAKDVTVTGTFSINKYKLTYTVDGEEYKTYEVEYGATITPEAEPTKEGYTFSGWSEIPQTMPAHDVTVTGTFTQVIYDIDDVTYEITGEGTVTVKGGEQKGEMTIEATVVINGQNYRVTAIADNAFKDNKNITSLTIPEGITTIGDNAFNGCIGLILINIGKDIQYIGNKAFANVGTVSAARTRSAESSIVVNCYAESVPQTALDAFENTPIETASLFVDDNSVNAYKTTSPWSGFGKIMGFDEAAGIYSITIGTTNAHIYDMQGNRLDNVRKGVNIIRMKDGKTKKVMVK